MRAGDGKLHPFGNIGRVVADTLQILGDHQHIEYALAVLRVLRDLRDKVALALVKQTVYHIIIFNNAPCKGQVTADKRIQAVGHHFNGCLRHAVDMRVVTARTGQIRYNLRNITCLVTDTLDIRDHFQHGRDQTQIACNRLLLQQQLEAHGLDFTFLAVDLLIDADGGSRQLDIALKQSLYRTGDCVFAQCPHRDQLIVHLRKLIVKTVSH